MGGVHVYLLAFGLAGLGMGGCGHEADRSHQRAEPFGQPSTDADEREVIFPDRAQGSMAFSDADEEEFSEFHSMREYYRNLESKGLAATSAVAIMGGFNSCSPGPYGTHIFKRALKMLQDKAKQGQYFRIVASCFKKSNARIYYYTSSDLETLKWTTPANVPEVVRKEAHETSVHGIYIVGHSYGGWLALKTAYYLPSQKVALRGLATLDPISAIHCKATRFINGYLRSVFSYNPEPGCTQAPRDYSATQRWDIARKSGWWYNFYQTNSPYLHSSHMGYASNRKLTYNYSGIWTQFAAHMAADNDERAWRIFAPKIVATP